MKSIIKKILKEDVNRKHLFTICKKIDSYLTDKGWKEGFFGVDGGHEMADTYDHILSMLLNKFGYDINEARFILGVYYSTYEDVTSDDITDPDDILIPEKSKYETSYSVYVSGNQSGKMKTYEKVYSPAEASFEIKNEGNYEKTIEYDETEWDNWEIEIPYKKY